MRHKLLGQPTLRQSQISASAATADIDNDQTGDEIIERLTTINNPSINYDSKLFVHYTHEKRFQSLKTRYASSL
jgi:hypothetical protein